MRPRSTRLPFDSPRWVPLRAVVIGSLAAGAAAVTSLSLVRDMPSEVVLIAAAGAAVLGLLATQTRSRGLVALALLSAVPLTFAASVLVWRVWRDHEVEPALLLMASVVFGIPAALVGGALVWSALRVSLRPTHDALDRVLGAASLWLALVAGGSVALGALVASQGAATLGTGGLTRWVQIAALGLGAGFAVAVFARDRGRARWLGDVLAGRVPGWSIVPRGDGEAAAVEPYVGMVGMSGALVSSEAEGSAPFRRAAVSTTVAWAPQSPRVLRERTRRAACLALAQGLAALHLLDAWWAHHRPLDGVLQIAVGANHACARLSDRSVRCWGRNDEGQLGDGSRENRYSSVEIRGIDSAVEIAAGASYTCARKANATVACWGANDASGANGVPGLFDVARIRVSEDLACALTESGEVWCWVAPDGRAQSDMGADPRRLRLPDGGRVLDLAVGPRFVCLRRADGLFCQPAGPDDWRSSKRENGGAMRCLPDWETPLRTKPDDPPWVAGTLTAGGTRVCEVIADGRVRCWGEWLGPSFGSKGPCSLGAFVPDRRLPRARQIELDGNGNDCVIDAGGAALCWDIDRGWGEPILEGAVSLAAGGDTACAVRVDGTAWCWGRFNDYGQMGDGTRRSGGPAQVLR